MGLDWRILSLSSYMEALEAQNEMNNPDGGKAESGTGDGLKRFMKAHVTTQ